MSVRYALKVDLPNGGLAFGTIDADGSWRLAAAREWPDVALFARPSQARKAARDLLDSCDDIDAVGIARFQDSLGRPFETVTRI